MTTAGSVLKREREKRKISLAEISEETKINVNYLKAIEADDYSIFPGETYIIGFIRNYARVLGLDPLEIIGLYKSSKIQSQTEIIKKKEEVSEESLTAEKPSDKIKKSKVKEVPVVNLPETVTESELPPVKPRRKKITEIEKEKEVGSIRPLPLKRKIFINPVIIIAGLGSLLVLVLLVILIVNIASHLKSSKEEVIQTDLAELKYLEFEGETLKYDFVSGEYYKIKLGDKFHAIMFDRLKNIQDVNKTASQAFTNFTFYFDDIVNEIKLNEAKSIDFDLDGTFDLEFKVNSCNNEIINAQLKKLHPFIVATNLNLASQSITSNKGVKQTAPQTNKKRTTTTKQKIVFEAVVKERTYVKAFIDGVEQEGKIYYPNDKINFEANDVLQLKIGNAGGIIVKINGKNYKLGKRGEIANKVIKWEQDPYDETTYNLVIKDWQ